MESSIKHLNQILTDLELSPVRAATTYFNTHLAINNSRAYHQASTYNTDISQVLVDLILQISSKRYLYLRYTPFTNDKEEVCCKFETRICSSRQIAWIREPIMSTVRPFTELQDVLKHLLEIGTLRDGIRFSSLEMFQLIGYLKVNNLKLVIPIELHEYSLRVWLEDSIFGLKAIYLPIVLKLALIMLDLSSYSKALREIEKLTTTINSYLDKLGSTKRVSLVEVDCLIKTNVHFFNLIL